MPLLIERGTRVISNAGGVNLLACRAAMLDPNAWTVAYSMVGCPESLAAPSMGA